MVRLVHVLRNANICYVLCVSALNNLYIVNTLVWCAIVRKKLILLQYPLSLNFSNIVFDLPDFL